MSGEFVSDRISQRFGDNRKKRKGVIRLGCQNVNGIPENMKTTKSKKMIHSVKDWNLDVWACSEIKIRWDKIDSRHQWAERTTGFKNRNWLFAHNRHENGRDKFLPGGVGIMAVNEMRGRIVEKGKDPSGIGRWTWMKLAGRSEKVLRVVSFYRPSRSLRKDEKKELVTVIE